MIYNIQIDFDIKNNDINVLLILFVHLINNRHIYVGLFCKRFRINIIVYTTHNINKEYFTVVNVVMRNFLLEFEFKLSL